MAAIALEKGARLDRKRFVQDVSYDTAGGAGVLLGFALVVAALSGTIVGTTSASTGERFGILGVSVVF